MANPMRPFLQLTLQYQLTKSGPLASNGIDAGFKIRPTEEELEEMGPAFRKCWDSYFKDKPDKPLMVSVSLIPLSVS